MSVGAWVTLVGATLSVVAILLRLWIKNSPERKKKRERDENTDISRAVDDGDIGWIRKFVRKARDESG